MTDLYDEWWTQREAIDEAANRGGQILITGLGLGLVAEAVLRQPLSRVTQITIVEASPDVIALVGPYLQTKYPGRIKIVHADAFAWTPEHGEHYTVGWHDIWPDPHHPANISEMQLLKDRYHQWCDWQGCWPQAYLSALSVEA
jgi:spermidine synthase